MMLVSEAFCQLYVKLLPISVSAFHLLTLIAIGIKCPMGDFFSVGSVIFFMNIDYIYEVWLLCYMKVVVD